MSGERRGIGDGDRPVPNGCLVYCIHRQPSASGGGCRVTAARYRALGAGGGRVMQATRTAHHELFLAQPGLPTGTPAS
jgi:hypothetical protein